MNSKTLLMFVMSYAMKGTNKLENARAVLAELETMKEQKSIFTFFTIRRAIKIQERFILSI
jgi:hypothetical protein